jgi:peroxiredoxin
MPTAAEIRGARVPPATFKTRVRDESIGGDNPYRWEDLTTNQVFNNRKVLIFSLPGAFTPTCTELQLPGFEAMYDQFIAAGVDEIYCVSVNDAFVMNKWAESLGVTKVKMLPDGSATFTGGLNMTVFKDNLGMGKRSWRYAAMVVDGFITHWWEEAGMRNDAVDDPYVVTCPDVVYADLVGE